MGRRLTLVVPSLALGGAERVVANMANHWAAGGDTVTVITLSAATTDTYSLDPAVTRIALNLMRESAGRLRAIFNNWIRVRRLRDAITKSRPDTVISFTDRMNVVTLLACRKLDVDVVISERIDPSQHQIGRDWSALRQMLYSRARALVVQTDSVRGQMKSIMDGHPIYVIPNFVERPADRSSESHSKATGALQLAAMGRLDYQKGFDLLIDAFAQAAKDQPNWSLVILGEGPERQRLEEQIHARGLEPRLRLLGWVSDPSSVLRDCDAFVLSSRFEGFPNALLEAMALGLPAIAVDCPSGPAEIVRNDVDGLLVPLNDTPALAAAIRRVMSDVQLRARLSAEAVQVAERFSADHYFARWDAVLRKDSSPDWDGQAKIWTDLICCRVLADNIETAAQSFSERLGIDLQRRESVNYAKPYYYYRAPDRAEEIFLTVNEDEDGTAIIEEFPIDALVLKVVARVNLKNVERRRQIQDEVKRFEDRQG